MSERSDNKYDPPTNISHKFDHAERSVLHYLWMGHSVNLPVAVIVIVYDNNITQKPIKVETNVF
jgi:hypothetical protein